MADVTPPGDLRFMESALLPKGTVLLFGGPHSPDEWREYLALPLLGRARWLAEHGRAVVAHNVALAFLGSG
jgi:hypothetical protein